MSDLQGMEGMKGMGAPQADDIAPAWRCGVSDTIGAIDAAFGRPLLKSRRKAERELGERLDRILQAIFDESRHHSPRSYREATAITRSLIAAGIEAGNSTEGESPAPKPDAQEAPHA